MPFKFSPGHCGEGDCGCGEVGPDCFAEFTALGCNDINLPGATVRVWTNPGKGHLLASGTTNGSGYVSLTFPAATSVDWYYEISHSSGRLVTASGETSCGFFGDAAVLETLQPAAGYQCWGNCYLPVKETLFLTSAATGPVTMAWDGSTWVGTASINLGPPPVEAFCDSGTASIGLAFNAGLVYVARHKLSGVGVCGSCVNGLGSTLEACGGTNSGTCFEDGAFVYSSSVSVRVGDGGTVAINATTTE